LDPGGCVCRGWGCVWAACAPSAPWHACAWCVAWHATNLVGQCRALGVLVSHGSWVGGVRVVWCGVGLGLVSVRAVLGVRSGWGAGVHSPECAPGCSTAICHLVKNNV